jgi:hypothetical protein
MTLIVAPKRFCDHEVIRKALICVFIRSVGLQSWPTQTSLLDPLRVGAFSMVGGHCALLHRDILTMWYVTAKPFLCQCAVH